MFNYFCDETGYNWTITCGNEKVTCEDVETFEEEDVASYFYEWKQYAQQGIEGFAYSVA